MRILAALGLLLSICACSNRAIYENIQSNNRSDCQKEAPGRYEECVAKTKKTFEEYERERKEALDN